MQTTRTLVALILLAAASFGIASARPRGITVWSGIIPDALPGIDDTWTLQADGRYVEDGVWRASRTPAQVPLSGRWTSSTDILVLRQDTFGFVFHGVIEGDWFSGELYEDGTFVAKFCARKGGEPPRTCETTGLVS